MNLLKTFEQRVADAFGAAPQGYTAPFSFKRLAKRAAREMERETFVIDDVDTAPALYTILVSPTDDVAMRMLYPRLTTEVVEYVKGEAARKGYVFVGEPLARFMVDDTLRSGKFAVFAENIDARTLQALRQEEATFLQGSSALGGAAADLASPSKPVKKRPARRLRTTASEAPSSPRPSQAQGSAAAPQIKTIPTINSNNDPSQIFSAASIPPLDDASSVGLDVIPMDFLDEHIPVPASDSADPLAGPLPSAPLGSSLPSVIEEDEEEAVTCMLIDHQTGRTYIGKAPSTLIGRERTTGNIVLRDPNVSRIHAELNFDGHVWRIRDLGSTNGTLVNDMDITQKVLRDGDIVTIGLMNLEFREN